MLSHAQIWSAIDAIASRYGLTASGLARRAGLDPTTFNKSKRVSPDGRLRWPSTESLAKVLDATGASLDEFIGLVSPPRDGGSRRIVPMIGLAEAGNGGHFTAEGGPTGKNWDEVEFLDARTRDYYALEISGDSMAPLYRDGDVVICSPSASVRRGDRVVVATTTGEVIVKELRRRTAKVVELASYNPETPDRILQASEVAWIVRILWVSQ